MNGKTEAIINKKQDKESIILFYRPITGQAII